MRNNWNVKNGASKMELRSFGKWYENAMVLAAAVAKAIQHEIYVLLIFIRHRQIIIIIF